MVIYGSLSVLLTACVVTSYFQMRKYFEGQATVAFSVETWHDELDLPAVSFCPGFKRERVVELVWPVRFLNTDRYKVNETYEDTFPTTREGMEALWDEITYGPDEIILTVGAQYQGLTFDETGSVTYRPEDLLGRRIGCLSLDRHDTISGRCYTVTTWCKVAAASHLQIVVNFANISEGAITASLHHPKAFLGNNANFYPGPVQVEKMERDSDLDLVVYTKRKRRVDDEGEGGEEDDYLDCVNDAIRASALASAGALCYHPSFRSILGEELSDQLTSCASELEYFYANFALMDIVSLLISGTGCKRPTSETSYSINRRDHVQVIFLREMAILYVSLGNTDVTVQREYTLQDFYAIVATLGGSIGIFIGWSLYDLAKLLARGIERGMGKVKELGKGKTLNKVRSLH